MILFFYDPLIVHLLSCKARRLLGATTLARFYSWLHWPRPRCTRPVALARSGHPHPPLTGGGQALHPASPPVSHQQLAMTGLLPHLLLVASATAQYRQQEPYQADPYQADPYQADPYQADPYQANPYQAEPYQETPYQPDPYQVTAYQEPYSPPRHYQTKKKQYQQQQYQQEEPEEAKPFAYQYGGVDSKGLQSSKVEQQGDDGVVRGEYRVQLPDGRTQVGS